MSIKTFILNRAIEEKRYMYQKAGSLPVNKNFISACDGLIMLVMQG